MLQVPLKEIPRDRSKVVEVEASADELVTMFDDVEDFTLGAADVFDAKLKLQRVGDAVRVAGWAALQVEFDCGRCLEHRAVEVGAELEYLLVSKAQFDADYAGGQTVDEDEEAGLYLTPQDLDVHYYEGDEVELLPLIREALLLELPPFAVCPEELEEQCRTDYEANVGAKAIEANEEASIDPRWAKLLELKKKDQN